ncbi:MAG: hypothetical protein FWD94_02790 [Treponema sp.]|nr:hypothetical protein [Treponema sp.]
MKRKSLCGKAGLPIAGGFLLLTAALVLGSCGLHSIFYDISTEKRPAVPRVPGSPSQIALFDGTLYVASGKLFAHADGRWGDPGIPQPPRRLVDLAATDDFLYALSLSGTGAKTGLWRIAKGGGNWSEVGLPATVQNIFADGADLYVGIGDGDSYSIRKISGSGSPTELAGDVGLLSGAAGGFLVTRSGHVRDSSGNSVTSDGAVFMGVIDLGGEVVAVSRDGILYRVDSGGASQITKSDGSIMDTNKRLATGALAVWEGNVAGKEGKMLLVGVQSSSSVTTLNNGYVEFPLTADGKLDPDRDRNDAEQLASVQGQNAQYRTSLGRLPVSHLFQAPVAVDSERTLYASTLNSGLWSFRTRDGVLQWNAED